MVLPNYGPNNFVFKTVSDLPLIKRWGVIGPLRTIKVP